MSDSVRPHRWQPTRLRRPWDSPGKNSGVGCHFLLPCIKVKVKSLSKCPTLCDPMDYSLPGSSVHGIFRARVLEWVTIGLLRDISSIHHLFLALSTRCPERSSTLVEMSLSSPLVLVFHLHKNQCSLKKCLTPRMRERKNMTLKHLVKSESKEMLKE